jgi:hypothetical protein
LRAARRPDQRIFRGWACGSGGAEGARLDISGKLAHIRNNVVNSFADPVRTGTFLLV